LAYPCRSQGVAVAGLAPPAGGLRLPAAKGGMTSPYPH